MRRAITAALLALFTLQSSGAAMAMAVQSPSHLGLLAQIQAEFSDALRGLAMTHVGAFVFGRESQYEAMHAPPPDFRTARVAHQHSSPMKPPHVSPRIPGPGVFLHPRIGSDVGANVAANHSSVRRRSMFPGHLQKHANALKPMTAAATAGSDITGIDPWWTYEEGSIPGDGRWMVNVGTGNLVVQRDDVNIPERGINLAFRRTYNSQSSHDYANSDNSVPSNYGNGWTNTFDAHLGYNASTNVITVWDIDGARYDYASDGNGGWTPPAGQYAILQNDGGGCGLFWTKKNGTRYHFWTPYASCGTPQGYWGRICIIEGRNRNNWIRFDYAWDGGDASSSAHLNQINAVHADTQVLTLKFADFSGYRELANVTMPDGAQVSYGYDTNGNLNAVQDPANNSGRPWHSYSYYAGSHQLNWMASPLYAQGTWAAQGGYSWFDYDSSSRVSGVQLFGSANFTPNDGTNQPLQPIAQQAQQIYYKTFTYPNSTETQLTDTDGHATNWFYDTGGRVTETQEWTGAPNNLWLVSYGVWDNFNNLAASLDPRSNGPSDTTYRTDYAHDPYGNTIAIALPATTTNEGVLRPTAWYSYDQHNNVTAYCDANYVGSNGYNWQQPIGPDDRVPGRGV